MKYNSITEINSDEINNVTGGVMSGEDLAIFVIGCSFVITGIAIALGMIWNYR